MTFPAKYYQSLSCQKFAAYKIQHPKSVKEIKFSFRKHKKNELTEVLKQITISKLSSTTAATSKAKKSKMSKKRRDAVKNRAEEQTNLLGTDQPQPERHTDATNCKQYILVDDYIGMDITPL